MFFALLGAVAVTLGPLYVFPVAAIAAWYAVVRIAASPAITVVWTAAFTLLGDKMVLSTGLGEGTGLLRVGPLLSFVLLAAMLLVDHSTRSAVTDVVRWGAPAALFVTFGAALPLLGVAIDYPVRTITASLTPLATGAFIVFGLLTARAVPDTERVRFRALATVTVIAALTGLALFLHYRGIANPVGALLDQWGIATAEAYGATWLRGRVGGLYVNPNILGTLGGLALLLSALGKLTPGQRIRLAAPAVIILFITQSRGVMAGALVAIAVAYVSMRPSARTRPRARVWHVPVLVLVVIALIAAVSGAAAVFPQHIESLSERIVSGLRIVTEGAQADRNFAARLVFWESSWELLRTRVLGTFGPPELLLGSAVDNDFLRLALQGGFLYTGSLLVFLAWLAWSGLRNGLDRFMGAGAIFIGLTSLTQTPSTYVMIVGMFSLFVGMHIERVRRQALGIESTPGHGQAGDSS